MARWWRGQLGLNVQHAWQAQAQQALRRHIGHHTYTRHRVGCAAFGLPAEILNHPVILERSQSGQQRWQCLF